MLLKKVKPFVTVLTLFAASGCFTKSCSNDGDSGRTQGKSGAFGPSTTSSKDDVTTAEGNGSGLAADGQAKTSNDSGATNTAAPEEISGGRAAQGTAGTALSTAVGNGTGSSPGAAGMETATANAGGGSALSQQTTTPSSGSTVQSKAGGTQAGGVQGGTAPEASATQLDKASSTATAATTSSATSSTDTASKGPYTDTSVNHPPEFSANPTLIYDGTAASIGHALTCQFTAIDWDKGDEIKTTVTWQSAASASGPWSNLAASNNVYVPQASDAGRSLRCSASATDLAAASVQASSPPVSIPAAPAALAAPATTAGAD